MANDLFQVNSGFYTGGGGGSAVLPGLSANRNNTVNTSLGGSLRNPTSQTREASSLTQSQGQKARTVSSETGTRNTQQNEQQTRNIQNVTDPVLALINQQAAGFTAGNETLQATDAAREQNIQAILDRIAGFDEQAIMAGAEGNVADEMRNLMENILPQITGAVEASGASNSALAALSANDAASRTAEAQARIREEARSNAANEFVNMIQAATGATQFGSAEADAISQFLNASKGAVEQGTIDTNTTGTETFSTTGESTTDTDTETTSTGEESKDTYDQQVAQQNAAMNDAMRLAILQASLSPFQTLQDLTYNSMLPGNTGPGADARLASTRSLNQLASRIGF